MGMAALLGTATCILVGPAFWAILAVRGRSEAGNNRAGRRRRHAQRAMQDSACITAAYHKEYSWTEATVLLRKMAFRSLSVMTPITYSPGAQLLPVILILVVYVVFHVKCSPYLEANANRTEQASLVAALVMSCCALYLCSDAEAQTETTRLAMLGLIMCIATGTMGMLACMIFTAFRNESKLAESKSFREITQELQQFATF